MWTIVLLTVSNVFMTFAWYGHLKNLKSAPLWLAVLASWGIAFFEYCFQVPANRLGYGTLGGRFNLAQLKTIQEVITLAVFCVFSILYMNQGIRWNYLVGFALIVAAVFFVFMADGGGQELAGAGK
ncbi:MAG: DMT family protein [Planctomycetes bacterium]|nr:DMT family protein [Planctomycetota bacterium]